MSGQKMRHTPGYWKVVENENAECKKPTDRDWEVAGLSHNTIACFCTKADAQLIAAAPELLTFAELVVHYADKIRKGKPITAGQWEMLVAQSRAAISKATSV